MAETSSPVEPFDWTFDYHDESHCLWALEHAVDMYPSIEPLVADLPDDDLDAWHRLLDDVDTSDAQDAARSIRQHLRGECCCASDAYEDDIACMEDALNEWFPHDEVAFAAFEEHRKSGKVIAGLRIRDITDIAGFESFDSIQIRWDGTTLTFELSGYRSGRGTVICKIIDDSREELVGELEYHLGDIAGWLAVTYPASFANAVATIAAHSRWEISPDQIVDVLDGLLRDCPDVFDGVAAYAASLIEGRDELAELGDIRDAVGVAHRLHAALAA